jgi:uncharacterized membrane protein
MTGMSIFEILMLICFGVSWPISIANAIKTKNVTGKSRAFLVIIIAGYASGIIHKVLYSMDWVIFLYIINLILVLIDLFLCVYYEKKGKGR